MFLFLILLVGSVPATRVVALQIPSGLELLDHCLSPQVDVGLVQLARSIWLAKVHR